MARADAVELTCTWTGVPGPAVASVSVTVCLAVEFAETASDIVVPFSNR